MVTCTYLRSYVVGLTLVLLGPVRVGAEDPRYKDREIALLPKYCQSRMGLNNYSPEDTQRWVGVMGPTYDHIHHYCRGQLMTNRANLAARDQQQKLFFLEQSIVEYDYVINLAPQTFVLLPEILTKKGESLIRLGKGPQAAVQLERAIQLKQDYWPPYAAMGDYYRDVGDRKKAREWLEKGLAAAPGTRALTRRLEELESAKDQRKSAPRPAKEPEEPKPPAKKG